MRALITGVTGQDGYFLSRFLLDREYEVFGLIRGQDNPKRAGVDERVKLVEGDLTDMGSLIAALGKSEPDEVYNLGAISHVGFSFSQPELTANVTGLGCLRLLDAIRTTGKPVRFYQASSSEMFGLSRTSPQSEDTAFNPRSPYACAKVFAHYVTKNYREAYGIYACSGILFNHESERRGAEFVTRKVTRGVAAIVAGLASELRLGNLDARRDWGYAPDYVAGMWMMLQQPQPDDYVLATGTSRSVADFCEAAFSAADLDWKEYVRTDKALERPADVPDLVGDASKAQQILGWAPATTFDDMVKIMVQTDLESARNDSPSSRASTR